MVRLLPQPICSCRTDFFNLGVIYILLLLYVIFQFKDSNAIAVSQISLAFGISCILNALWIVFWHYGRLPLSLLVMAGLLASLIYINIAIRDLPFGIIKTSFGIYLGWICIATIANVTEVLVSTGWNGFNISHETWTIIMIAVGALLVALTIYRIKNPFVGLAVVWAFLGIAIKRQQDYRTIFITAVISMVIIGGVTIWGFIRKSMV
ncbi:MAG TPA: hypothetical protein DCY25_08430 [Bacteroidales bacterium]|nr:hypothetical protein [Bacteroidales bacterium]